MGSLLKESYVGFLDSLKKSGVLITNETELRERLAEAQRWRYAFMTLAAHGKAIGIQFIDGGARSNNAMIRKAFNTYAFPAEADRVFAANLASD
ncbi:MAG: hypothetical protein FWD62_15015 [Betaproteobacteria bacterium]|nr:hypothetical protein [Betaproteobacteria bacterium]